MAEKVHNQLDNMGVRILAKEHPGNTATPRAMDNTVIPSAEELGSYRRVHVQRFQDGRGEALPRGRELELHELGLTAGREGAVLRDVHTFVKRHRRNVQLRSSAVYARTPRMRSGSWLPSGKRARAAQDLEAADENTTVSCAHGSARARRQVPVEGR